MENIDIKTELERLKNALLKKVDVASLYKRSKVAHKWKLTYRLLVTREAIFWRFIDILTPSYELKTRLRLSGSLILIRAALETVCLLIYMNEKIKSVVEEKITFNDFEEITARLLLGSKNIDFMPEPINVMKLIEDSEKKYPGIKQIYYDLSETTHPNYAGVCDSYTRLNKHEYETEFGIFLKEEYSQQSELAIKASIAVFNSEYNEWAKWFERLEKWLEKNDKKLERQRRKHKEK